MTLVSRLSSRGVSYTALVCSQVSMTPRFRVSGVIDTCEQTHASNIAPAKELPRTRSNHSHACISVTEVSIHRTGKGVVMDELEPIRPRALGLPRAGVRHRCYYHIETPLLPCLRRHAVAPPARRGGCLCLCGGRPGACLFLFWREKRWRRGG